MKRIAKHFLAFIGVVALFLTLQACTSTGNLSEGGQIQTSPSSDWGSSISFGVHSHGRGW